jgi:colicin import membrane protein
VPKLRQSLPILTVHGHKIAASSLVAAAIACGVFGSTVGSTPPAHAAATGSSKHATGGASAPVRIPAVKPSAHATASASPSGNPGQAEDAPITTPPAATTSPAAPATTSTSADSGQYSGLSAQQDAAMIVPADQLDAFDWIIDHESGWDVTAENPSSGAYGLGQALPAYKMAAYGSDYMTDPVTQIKWALAYMDERYGSPDAAQSFWEANGWY